MEPSELLRLARDRSRNGRARLSEAVSSLLLSDSLQAKPVERHLILDILAQIVRDIEATVRRHLSERLATDADVPPALARALADDEIQIAFPILANSPVLNDKDLIDLIRRHATEHHLAIASRPSLCAEVSDALVATRQPVVTRRLIENHGAVISAETLATLVEDSRHIKSYQEPLLKRPDLPPALARRMFVWVTAALRQYILDNFGLDQVLVDDAVFGAGGRALDEYEGQEQRAGELPFPVRVLVEALADGHIFQFVAMIRQLTGLREVLLLRLLAETTGEGLAVLLCALGVDEKGFAAVYFLVRRVRGETAGDTPHAQAARRSFFNNLTRVAAIETVNAWRRGVDYLAALQETRLK